MMTKTKPQTTQQRLPIMRKSPVNDHVLLEFLAAITMIAQHLTPRQGAPIQAPRLAWRRIMEIDATRALTFTAEQRLANVFSIASRELVFRIGTVVQLEGCCTSGQVGCWSSSTTKENPCRSCSRLRLRMTSGDGRLHSQRPTSDQPSVWPPRWDPGACHMHVHLASGSAETMARLSQ